MKEIWKDIEGYEGYQVSNMGRVRSFKYGKVRILKPVANKNGYLKVQLYKNNSLKTIFIHRLVAMAFIPNPNNLPQVNHKDEDKTNNIVSNLEWCDAKYNSNYGTARKRMIEKIQKVVIQIDKNTNVIINIFPSLMEAERQTGYNHGHICKCCKGKLKTTGGYKWSYKDSQS